MTSSYDVVVLGAFGLSTSVELPAEGRRHGVEVTFTDVLDFVGQAGGDSALGFTALGRRTAVVGHVGADRQGDWVRAELARAGIDLQALDIDPAGTARSVSMISSDGSRRGFYDGRGHMIVPVPEHAAAAVAASRLALFHLSNWSRQLLPVARAAGVTIAADLQDLLDAADPYRRDYVEQADIVFFSAANVPDPTSTINAVLAGRNDRVVVTGMGARGCAVGTADGVQMHPPVSVDRPVIDTMAPVMPLPSASSPRTSWRAGRLTRRSAAPRLPPAGSAPIGRARPTSSLPRNSIGWPIAAGDVPRAGQRGSVPGRLGPIQRIVVSRAPDEGWIRQFRCSLADPR